MKEEKPEPGRWGAAIATLELSAQEIAVNSLMDGRVKELRDAAELLKEADVSMPQRGESEASMIYNELHAVIRRWINEGDELLAFSVIGALEAVKADFMDNLKRHNESRT